MVMMNSKNSNNNNNSKRFIRKEGHNSEQYLEGSKNISY